MRSLARETVFKFIFSQLFNPSDEGLFDMLKLEAKLNKEDSEFADELLSKVIEGKDEYLKKIEALSVSYKINRIFNADKCALIIGMAEVDNFKDTPKIVAVDEAVKLSVKYSTEGSANFVNGILAKYIGG